MALVCKATLFDIIFLIANVVRMNYFIIVIAFATLSSSYPY